MTKLEAKLQELGYRNEYLIFSTEYEKNINNINLCIKTNKDKNKIEDWVVVSYKTYFITTKDVNDFNSNLEQAFNEMQKDLEELKNA